MGNIVIYSTNSLVFVLIKELSNSNKCATSDEIKIRHLLVFKSSFICMHKIYIIQIYDYILIYMHVIEILCHIDYSFILSLWMQLLTIYLINT